MTSSFLPFLSQPVSDLSYFLSARKKYFDPSGGKGLFFFAFPLSFGPPPAFLSAYSRRAAAATAAKTAAAKAVAAAAAKAAAAKAAAAKAAATAT